MKSLYGSINRPPSLFFSHVISTLKLIDARWDCDKMSEHIWMFLVAAIKTPELRIIARIKDDAVRQARFKYLAKFVSLFCNS